MSDRWQRAFDRAEQAIEEQWTSGLMSDDERNRELRELQRDYIAAAEEAAQDAYDAERERW